MAEVPGGIRTSRLTVFGSRLQRTSILSSTESWLASTIADGYRSICQRQYGADVAPCGGLRLTRHATLQRFPLNTIKIDRSLVAGLCAGAEKTEFAESVIAMGKNLSLTVVAQGVETRAQAEFLRAHACDELQGFYLSRPLPPDEFAKLLLANHAEGNTEPESRSA